ncbi:CDP-glycerol glycerophosphotransferase family protein [Nocardioides aurantiacus]|uniref:CDP-glycerol glycerophosphotransferase (TagB/SpsB family) n=1 Tax=Nocardioides aurantiacus TaxID=86796 RepID=A0A3N2CSV3_9ACTN|nr:CDP-glycerol glycerophosphotransferase family protein [Nocardioides aurantiacus]ROR90496.1 CDP-glycerol glycerophosphotransferase (TagB/SpsB family) [Nocardioides aurantiacus]
MRSVRPRRHAVVHGVPDREGNAVEVLRHLLQHYDGEVYWLVASDGSDATWMLADLDRSRLHPVPKRSLRAFHRYVTAELVFFTHGLFGSPPPPADRTVVNVWHGDGPKRTANSAFRAQLSSTYLVAGTEQFGRSKAAGLGMSPSALLVTGNPRVDQMGRPVAPAALAALGLDPAAPVVVWAPTYRESGGGEGQSWSDSGRLSTRADLLEDLRAADDLVRRLGGQIVVKPHMLDADDYATGGFRVITDADLAAAQVSFYGLLGHSRCLVTDYSSIWTDYLTLDRPIGHFCPDLEEYQLGRGFNVTDFAGSLAGPLLQDRTSLLGFLQEVLDGGDPEGERRERVATEIGAVTALGATERLMAALGHPALRTPHART